ncbi:MAG: DUF488 domain-containing protein [Marinobacter sp.]|uniref:DUF488 domain-containing protein n=1 Tax=Marinobacter sp. TaxID=50741 RepID=UPI003F9A10C3
MTLPFCTVGHSTRTIEAFVELLKTADVELVVDIRSVPKSRTNPQYNKESLPELLAPFHIAYEQVAELGGLRRKSKEVSAEVNGFWENRSFHNYADYALTDSFHSGLDQLIELGRERRCAVMCAEAVWWRCHRRIVTDYLISCGETVFHLMNKDRMEPASLTRGARVDDSRVVFYPAGNLED